ncbi:hypothetical protein BJ508DRAFT_335364 [Ascobolus immersus RN42]|uniref:Uncharacterized protein n=1 Tax=Ascobolus immersus RN42 TaxID=1160509 RepID=A0A3N4HR45_ASCIM|nr:hypothetical protein BJ508DRAFT_335364 [Ascobolus immersus RN42]
MPTENITINVQQCVTFSRSTPLRSQGPVSFDAGPEVCPVRVPTQAPPGVLPVEGSWRVHGGVADASKMGYSEPSILLDFETAVAPICEALASPVYKVELGKISFYFLCTYNAGVITTPSWRCRNIPTPPRRRFPSHPWKCHNLPTPPQGPSPSEPNRSPVPAPPPTSESSRATRNFRIPSPPIKLLNPWISHRGYESFGDPWSFRNQRAETERLNPRGAPGP